MCNCNSTITTIQNHVCKPKCPPQEDCTCPVRLNSECVTYNGNDLECSGIESGLPLNQTIELLDTYICEAIDEISTAINLVNVGTGEDIYAGIDGIGRRKIKRVNSSSPILTITPNENDITFGVDEEALNENINISNVGSGVESYKGYNSTTNKHEFRTVVQENQGTGESFLRDIQQTTDELKVRVKTLVSDNLTITTTDEEVRIETPMTASIPALYVNNLYVPTYQEWLAENSSQNSGIPVVGFQFIGKGTLAQPFTDTIVYTLNAPLTPPVITSNTSIQNALDGDSIYSYVGNGTSITPEKIGQRIIIQDNNSNYVFSGNFEYTSLKLTIDAIINSSISGYIIDMDNLSSLASNNIIEIEVLEGKRLNIQGQGFKNDGTTVATNNFIDYRQIRLIGDGYIASQGTDITKYILTSDKNSVGNTTTGFNNDGALQFEIRCYLESEFQGILALGGISQILVLGGTFQTGSVSTDVDVNLKAFYLKGGFLRVRRNSTIVYYGSTTTDRLKLFYIEPTNSFTPNLELSDTLMAGNCETIFSKENNLNAIISVVNSGGSETNCINVFGSTNLWIVSFRNNIFNSGTIDFTKADLTSGNNVSTTNTIGNTLIETLVSYTSRESARLAGLPSNSAFLIKKFVSADNLVAGVEYQITTEGVPSLGTEGSYITATGSETGTGVGMYTERCVLV